jgi:hypothetical protein
MRASCEDMIDVSLAGAWSDQGNALRSFVQNREKSVAISANV